MKLSIQIIRCPIKSLENFDFQEPSFQVPFMQKPELSMSLLTPERNHREFPNYPPPEMGYYSQAHICQCLTRLSTLKRNSIVTFSGHRKKTGHEFVRSVLSLAGGLLKLGVRNGDVVAISAFNRYYHFL